MPALRKICPVIAALALTACAQASDPASEAPVELLVGQYEVAVAGQAQTAFGKSKNSSDDFPAKICLAGPDDAARIAKLARTYYSMDQGCSHSASERVGNAVGGKISCPTDPERVAGGEVGVSYTGKLTADTVNLEGKFVFDFPTESLTEEEQALMKDGADEMDRIAIVVEAKRIGDCP